MTLSPLRRERWDVGSWECHSVNCVKLISAEVIVATTAVENCIFKSKRKSKRK